MGEYRNWFREHSSAVLLLTTCAVSIALFALGTIWEENSTGSQKAAGVVLTQLSGALLAALLAIVFFSLDDVKNQIAASAAKLLTSGDLVKSLSKSAREVLDQQLALQAVAPQVLAVDPSLFAVFSRVRAESLSCHHLHNFYQEITVTPHETDSRLVIRRHVRHFRVKAYHLDPASRVFPFKYNLEVGLPDNLDITPDDVLKEFQVVAGETILTRDHAKIEGEISGTTPVVTIRCTANLQSGEEMDFRLTVTTLGSVQDNAEMFIARCPVFGARLVFRYREDLLYDCAWFKNWPSGGGYRAGRENLQQIPDGVMAFTNDWVLPGEGVTCTWYPKPKKVLTPPIANLEFVDTPAAGGKS